MQTTGLHDPFELCLDKYPDLPSVVLIRSTELKSFPKEYLKEPVLDLCCGDGFFTSCLGASGVYGCDIDQKALEHAATLKETYRAVRKSDARSLAAFNDSEFNTVFSNCALEHIDGIDSALKNSARVLKPGGHLIMSVPDANLNTWFFAANIFRRLGFAERGSRLCDEYNKKQAHINIYTCDIWRKKLEENGLSIKKSFYLFSEREYKLILFFESFVLDSFPGPFLRRIHSLFRKGMSLSLRKALWRKLLKPIYLRAQERDSGGELLIVARKI